MTSLARWIRFNLVGAGGMAIQLTALAFLNRTWHGRYLIASAAGVELALLHNFSWHVHYTWRDCRDGLSRWQQLVRFHLSNGLLSLLGNVALMRLLVHTAHLPVLAASIVAILCCSVANFWFSNRFTFPAQQQCLAET